MKKIHHSQNMIRGSVVALLALSVWPVFLAEGQRQTPMPTIPAEIEFPGEKGPAQEMFVAAFLQARKAEEFTEKGEYQRALEAYTAAAEKLGALQKQFPAWQREIVNFRAQRVSEGVAKIRARLKLGPEPSPNVPPVEPPKPAKPPVGDPFVRDGKPAAAAEPENADEHPFQLYGLVEYIEVPRDAWLEYSGKHAISINAEELRAEVQRWIAAGQAKPIELTCVSTMSGNRMVVESTITRNYGTKRGAAIPSPVPTSTQAQRSHLVFEWESVFNGRTIDSNIAPQLAYFCGSTFPVLADRERAQPGDLGVPLVVENKMATNISTEPDQPTLLSVATPPDDKGEPRDEARTLTFFRTAPVPLRAAKKTNAGATWTFSLAGKQEQITEKELAALLASSNLTQQARGTEIEQALKAAGRFPGGLATVEIEKIEVTLADLNAWFAGKALAVATDDLREAAIGWVAAGRGRVLDRRNTPLKSGNRSVWETVKAVRYPMGYSYEGAPPAERLPSRQFQPKTFDEYLKWETLKTLPPAGPAPKNPAVFPTEDLNTESVGSTLEIEPSLTGPNAELANMNIAVQDVQLCGQAVLHRREVNGQFVPDVEQPIFGTMKLATNSIVPLGVPSLLSIGTPATAEGKPEPQKRVITFITLRD